jgi:hypothetical protein
LGKFAYTLNSDGSRSKVDETDDQGDTRSTYWFYDNDNRLNAEAMDVTHDDSFSDWQLNPLYVRAHFTGGDAAHVQLSSIRIANRGFESVASARF